MKVLSPFQATQEESERMAIDFRTRVAQMNVSDDQLRHYVRTYFEAFRETVEKYLPSVASSMPFYANYPFETVIVRIGNNGIMTGHRPGVTTPSVTILRLEDLDPPLAVPDVFELTQRLQIPVMSFDFRAREYDDEEARSNGPRDALLTALDYFWSVVKYDEFAALCRQLLEAEGVRLVTPVVDHVHYIPDAVGEVHIVEPMGFRRAETWAFELKHPPKSRVSVLDMHRLQKVLTSGQTAADVMCVVTSGDLTSVGQHLSAETPTIRVWDRYVLNSIIIQSPEVLEPYFGECADAIRQFTVEQAAATPSRYEEFKTRLQRCTPGKESWREYEDIGTDLWQYLFSHALGQTKRQSQTIDGLQRRDVVFRNQRASRFWQRIAGRFGADFIIVDFKNYTDPVGSDVVFDVEKYANRHLGHFIVVVCRKGSSKSAEEAQVRCLQGDRDTAILVVNDRQMLEMVERKERNEVPEDLLEDLLDSLLLSV